MFASTTSRYEANADASVKLSDKWSTMLLAHYENETKTHDANDDGFADIPQVKQYNLFNRWAYMGDNYIFQAGIKTLDEKRTSGQVAHGGHTLSNPYLIHMNTDRYEAFVKQAYVFDKEHRHQPGPHHRGHYPRKGRVVRTQTLQRRPAKRLRLVIFEQTSRSNTPSRQD